MFALLFENNLELNDYVSASILNYLYAKFELNLRSRGCVSKEHTDTYHMTYILL